MEKTSLENLQMRVASSFFVLVWVCLSCATRPCSAEQESRGQTLAEQSKANADAPGQSTPVPEVDRAPPAPVRLEGTVARPKNGVRHPDLDEAWAEYDLIVAKVTEDIRAAIKKEWQGAVNKGDLDTAEKWEGIGKKFESEGECDLEKELGAIGKKSVLKLKSAHAALEKAYDSVVKALTREKKLPQAKAAKSELAGLSATVQAAAKEKQTQKATAMFVGAWKWPDGTSEEVRADGAWVTRGDPNDRWSGSWVLELQDPKGICVIRTTIGGRKGKVIERWYADPTNPNVLRKEDGLTISRE